MNKAHIRRQRHAPFLACLLLAAASISSAQVLARPGSKATAVKVAPWWPNAIFYNIAAGPVDTPALIARLDALRALHVDALIVPAPELPPPGSNAAMPNLDDLDNLLRQAGAHGIRVLLSLPAPSPTADLSGLARFWLNRGVAGLHIVSPIGTTQDQAQSMADSVRKVAATVAGQRIILSDLDLAPAPQADASKLHHTARRPSSPSGPQMQIDTRPAGLSTFDAATLRPILTQALAQPNLLLQLRASASPALHRAVATIALISQPASLIDSSANLALQPAPDPPKADEEPAKPAAPPPLPKQPPPGTYLPYVPYVPPPRPHAAAAPKPIPEDPLTTWYGQLAALHHGNPAFLSGATTFLDFDAQNALVWISQPPASHAPRPPAPVVVICNLSSSPIQLSLADAIKRLNLHGFFLRTLLRTDQAMGAQDINAISVPANGVYIGELHR